MKTLRYRFSLRSKTAAFLALAAGVSIVSVAALAYRFGIGLLFDTARNDRAEMASIIARYIGAAVDRDAAAIAALLNAATVRAALSRQNAAYAGIDQAEAARMLKAKDAEWGSGPAVTPFAAQYLDSPLSRQLAVAAASFPAVAGISVTDQYGGLVAASHKTADYYQADEPWWKEAFNEGAGRIMIGNIRYDLASDTIGFAVAAPVTDEMSGIIGIGKALVDIKRYWAPVRSCINGNGGHVAIVDKNGLILFSKDIAPLNTKVTPDDEWGVLMNRGWTVTEHTVWGIGRALVVRQEIPSEILADSGIGWSVVLAQPYRDLIAPYRFFQRDLLLGAAALMLLAFFCALIAGDRLARPVRVLCEGVTRVTAGDLHRHIILRTGDEFGELAVLFNGMVDHVRDAQEAVSRHAAEVERTNARLEALSIELKTANAELVNLKNELNRRVGERTEYLVATQEAVINMMEDLQSSKEDLERSSAETLKAYQELKDTQRRLVQSEKMGALGRFSAGIAHEVKNPLAIMLGGMEYLDAKLTAADADVRTVLVKIKEAILRADGVLQNLLKFARPARLETEVVYPEDMIAEVLSLFGYKFPLINIQIELSVIDKGMSIAVDKNQVEQVIFNLLINAMDAMPKGGVITIVIYRLERAEMINAAKGACAIEVRDAGEGIPPEVLAKLFEPFFTTKRDRGGTGLGLAVARSIIEEHSGALTMGNNDAGGAYARIILPLVRGA